MAVVMRIRNKRKFLTGNNVPGRRKSCGSFKRQKPAQHPKTASALIEGMLAAPDSEGQAKDCKALCIILYQFLPAGANHERWFS